MSFCLIEKIVFTNRCSVREIYRLKEKSRNVMPEINMRERRLLICTPLCISLLPCSTTPFVPLMPCFSKTNSSNCYTTHFMSNNHTQIVILSTRFQLDSR